MKVSYLTDYEIVKKVTSFVNRYGDNFDDNTPVRISIETRDGAALTITVAELKRIAAQLLSTIDNDPPGDDW